MSVQAVRTSENTPIRDQVSDEEWDARVKLAAFYRALARLGITDHIYNHITYRVPGEPGHFLLNAFGMTYPEVTASSLYKVDIEGNLILKPNHEFGLNRAAFVIHGAVHEARADLHCVAHTHARASMAVGNLKCGLLPLSQHACKFDGRISYHDFNGPVVDLKERERLVRDLGTNDVMLLRNHGTLICGKTIAETFLNVYFLEMACKVQVDTLASAATGGEMAIPSEEVLENNRRIFREYHQDGELEWNAMVRVLDAAGEDYAQ